MTDPTPSPALPEPRYPCDRCGTMRTKAEGGTIFTVCDECWDKDKSPTPPAADPAGAARTALPTRFRIAARGLVSDVLKADPEGEFVKYADVVSHLAGQAGPEVRGLVERLMSPTAEGTIETRTALLAAFAQSAAERDRLAGLLALTEKSLHLAETGIEVQKRAVKRAKDEGQALAARLAEAENLCAAIGGCRECGETSPESCSDHRADYYRLIRHEELPDA